MSSNKRSEQRVLINRDGSLYIAGTRYSGLKAALKHYDIDPAKAEKLLSMGVSLDKVFSKAFASIPMSTGTEVLGKLKSQANESGYKRQRLQVPNRNALSVGGRYKAKSSFKSLHKNYGFISHSLNEIHKFCDAHANSKKVQFGNPGCIVINTLSRLYGDISDAFGERWKTFEQHASILNCEMEEILDPGAPGCENKPFGEFDYQKIQRQKNADCLILRHPNGHFSSPLQASLGIVLRKRFSLGLTTVVFMNRPFITTTMEYSKFLIESFYEYGNELRIIDANPSRVL